jgi:hypothetical protein
MGTDRDQGPADERLTLRTRLGEWPAAVALAVIGALVLVTGAVLLWLVITSLGAFLKTVF